MLPPSHPVAGAIGCSLLVGAAVAIALAGRLPRSTDVRRTGTRYLASGLYMALKAFAEEAVWRGLVFAVLLPHFGPVGAAALSVVGFALVHVPSQRSIAFIHLLTGGAFLACYAVAGLWGAVAAHVAYNLMFLTLASQDSAAGVSA